MTFDFFLIIESLPRLLEGIWVTLSLLVLSTLIGLVLAIGLLLMRISGRWFLAWPAFAYIFAFRGTPILVQIFVIYHGLPQFDLIRESIFWPIFRDPFGCSVVALSLNSAAYVAEILRGGILGVDKGLHEAGKALGLSPKDRFIYVTTPIAVRLAIPAYSNDVVSMLKATALASTVTLFDITGVARTIVSETFAPYEIFISAALIYLVLTLMIQKGFTIFERRMSRYVNV
jgi:polar amino acid transport system permease protein